MARVVLVLVRLLLCFVVRFGWFSLVRGALHGLCLVPGLVRLLGLILVGGSSGRRRIFGRIGASSHQHVFRSARGSAGARKGSRLAVVGSSSPSLLPGPNSLKTTRGGKVQDRPWVSAHLSLRAEVRNKGISHHFFCLRVCVSVCGPRLVSSELYKCCVVVVRLPAAPVRGRHSGSSVMIRILIWHRFYTGCPS